MFQKVGATSNALMSAGVSTNAKSFKLCVFPWIRDAEFISCASPRVSVVFLTLAGTGRGGGLDAPPLRFFRDSAKTR